MCQSTSPKWRPNAEIAWHHDRYPRHWSIKPARVISVKTTRLVCVLLRRTQQRYSVCAVYNSAGKADLGNGYWNPKTKLWANKHFSEIIIASVWQKTHAMYTLFQNGSHFYILLFAFKSALFASLKIKYSFDS